MSSKATFIGFLSAPGGVGKTTLSLLLAWFYRKHGKRVLVMDLDPSLSLSLRLIKEMRLVELEKKGRTLTNIIRKIYFEEVERLELGDYIEEAKFPSDKDPTLDIIVPDMKLPDAVDSIWYGPHAGREYILKRVISSLNLEKNYDYVVIDTIPFYDKKYAIMTVYAVDKIIIPLRPTIIDIYRTGIMLKQLPKISNMPEKEIYSRIGLVFNMHDRRSKRQKMIIDKAKNIIKDRIGRDIYFFKTVIPNLLAFSRLGTEEEQAQDRKKVEDSFEPFFTEVRQFIKEN